ncbi:divalent-cation tolerance protein CutA [Longispora sp. K20-0274]|uniref:divalent-cation tolerance protein CutA n=1 Tax=Longispora sp. K20-0274 TaxID=3088255 RepID=UPI00399A4A4C
MALEFVQVSTTVASQQAAAELARSAVEARLAACAQIAGPITSIYWWLDSVESAPEYVIWFKTTVERYQDLEDHIRSGHTYDVPEVICVPIVAGNPDYLSWVRDESTAAETPQD